MINNYLENVFSYFPLRLVSLIKNETKYISDIYELRLRANKSVCISSKGTNIVLENIKVDKNELTEIFENICEHSVYTYQDEINQGYITLKCGSRVGVCGTAVLENDKILSVKNISSLNFRIANDHKNCANEIVKRCDGSYILAGPPLSGKTTLLRDIARYWSNNRFKVCVVDERLEIGGNGTFELGVMTDVLNGYKKAYGITLATRTLSPQIIIFDEISTLEECESVIQSFNSGIKIITSVHCKSKREFYKRPICKRLLDTGCFDYIVFLGNEPGKITEIERIKI